MVKNIFHLTIIILLLVAGCNPVYENVSPLDPLTLQDVLAISQERREGIIKPSIEYISQFTQGREERTVNMARFLSFRRGPESVTSQEAIDDFTMFSDALRQIYAAYIFFGGDEVFLPIFDDVKESLASQEYWQVYDFLSRIFTALGPVINDNHFSLGMGNLGWTLGNPYDFLVPVNFNDAFDNSENGFHNRRTGQYVKELLLDGQLLDFESEGIFRLSVSEDGMFYYSIVIVKPESGRASIPLTIVYENNSRDRISVAPIYTYRMPYDTVSLQYIQGFPVITIQEMYFIGLYHYASKALSLAEEFQNEPVLIVDIRSNRGGDSLLALRWFLNLTGEIVPSNFIQIIHSMGTASDIFGLTEFFSQYLAPIPIDERHELRYTHADRIVPSEQLLIILTDRFTASAGEVFTDMAFNLENTLVIGQNTWGVLQTDRSNTGFLPNSAIRFYFGRGLLIHPPGHFYEGIGIAPDIWVNGDALEAAIAMLNANAGYINEIFRQR